MPLDSKFRLLYHDINGNLQSVLGLLEIAEFNTEERYCRVKPYLLAINALYASLSREAPYDAMVNLKKYTSKLIENFCLEQTNLINFNTQDLDENTLIKTKDSVYLGFLIYEIFLTIFTKNNNVLTNQCAFLFKFEIQKNNLVLSLELDECHELEILKYVDNELKDFTLLSIINQQLKLKYKSTPRLIKFEYCL